MMRPVSVVAVVAVAGVISRNECRRNQTPIGVGEGAGVREWWLECVVVVVLVVLVVLSGLRR